MAMRDTDSGLLLSSRENSRDSWAESTPSFLSGTSWEPPNSRHSQVPELGHFMSESLSKNAVAQCPPDADTAATHSQQNVQQQLGSESGASEHPLLTIEKLSEALLVAANRYKGDIIYGKLFPNQGAIDTLLASKDYATIITIYTNKIKTVQDMSKIEPALSLHAPVHDSKSRDASLNDSKNRDASFNLSNTEPRGPIPVPQGMPRKAATRLRSQPRARARKPFTGDSSDENAGYTPTRGEFFEFLVDYVRTNPNEAPWSVSSLRRAYTKAHPTHVGYKCWLGTIDRDGMWSNGGWYTVKQILEAAFQDKPDNELESLMYTTVGQSTVPATGKKKRAESRFSMTDIYKFVIARLKEKQSSELKTETCTRIAGEVEKQWAVIASKRLKDAIKNAWEQVNAETPDATVLANLKALAVPAPPSSAPPSVVAPVPAADGGGAAAGAGTGSSDPSGPSPSSANAAGSGQPSPLSLCRARLR